MMLELNTDFTTRLAYLFAIMFSQESVGRVRCYAIHATCNLAPLSPQEPVTKSELPHTRCNKWNVSALEIHLLWCQLLTLSTCLGLCETHSCDQKELGDVVIIVAAHDHPKWCSCDAARLGRCKRPCYHDERHVHNM